VRLDLRITCSVPRKSSFDCIFDPPSAFTVCLCSRRHPSALTGSTDSSLSNVSDPALNAGGTLADRCSDLQAFVVVSAVEIRERVVRHSRVPISSSPPTARVVLRTSRPPRGTREARVHGLPAAHLRDSDPRTSREIWPAISLAYEQNVTVGPHAVPTSLRRRWARARRAASEGPFAPLFSS
jgi:hypothetical protein